MTLWHHVDEDQVVSQLAGDAASGLTRSEAAERLHRFGINDIDTETGRGPLRMLFAQFADFMIVVLIVAAVVSGVVGELTDTIAILVIVVLNATVGAIQEYRAQRAVEALRQLAPLEAQVLRDGRTRTILAREVVPGDLVILQAGDVVSADLRLLEITDLRIDESALTGESLAVSKSAETLHEGDLAVGDRRNMAYKSTSVSRGHAKGIVVATGPDTEIGKIAALLIREKGVKTPLQIRLSRFGRHLAIAILLICTAIFYIGLLQGEPALVMFLTAVSLAVAAIPEALPAVVVVSLALGARKLSQRNALVRRLPAVETLGSVTFICADKTGTLTENRMTVEAFIVDGKPFELERPKPHQSTLSNRIGQGLALNNDVQKSDQKLTGDPTEVALVVAAEQAGYYKEELLQNLPRLAEVSFDTDRKLMTTLHREGDGVIAFVKGAPEQVLASCDSMPDESGEAEFSRDAILEDSRSLAKQGYRVLALAFREFPSLPVISPATVESELTFLCVVGLTDPPRAEARNAVESCRAAGIIPVMITGDHPDTAEHIAARIGIGDGKASVMTGTDLAALSDDELGDRVLAARVYARVDPEQKIRIVRALQNAGQFVAMTGDGVNDAPALKRADIGVAMGKRGTEVAREAADMVLLDDNFATIVSAIREGRRVYDNIRKFLRYTMTSNSGEIWTLFLAPFFGLPIPLLPIQILWINLVTDGLPGLAFAAEPAERDVMKRPPRPPEESIFARGMWQHMLWVGLLIGALSISAQAWGYVRGADHWQTMVFTTLVIAQLFNALAIRSERESLWSQGLGSNPQLLGAVIITVLLQLAVIYVPILNTIFQTLPLPLEDLFVCFALGSIVFVAVEAEKWLIRKGWLHVKERQGNFKIST